VRRAQTAEDSFFVDPSLPKACAVGGKGRRTKQRAWLLLTHLINPQTEQFITGCFNDRGKQLLQLKQPGASLYLYELYVQFQ